MSGRPLRPIRQRDAGLRDDIELRILYHARVGLSCDTFDPGAEGFVLVGGRSSRFGSDKGLFEMEGRAMVLHVADALLEHVTTVTLVGCSAEYKNLGFPVIPDLLLGAGPLGGIVSALGHASAPRCLVAGCDMPLLANAPLAQLLQEAASTDVEALIPQTPDGRLQPLCAVYAKRASEPLRQALLEGERKIANALDWIRWRALLVDDPMPFFNVNRMSDLKSLG